MDDRKSRLQLDEREKEARAARAEVAAHRAAAGQQPERTPSPEVETNSRVRRQSRRSMPGAGQRLDSEVPPPYEEANANASGSDEETDD
jgi:hypothetical protein